MGPTLGEIKSKLAAGGMDSLTAAEVKSLSEFQRISATAKSNKPAPLESLSAKQRQAIEMLANAATVPQVCEKLRVHDRTLFRWRADPFFDAEYKKARERHLTTLAPRAISKDALSQTAMQCLYESMLAGDVRAAIYVAEKMQILEPKIVETQRFRLKFGSIPGEPAPEKKVVPLKIVDAEEAQA